jgi:oxygen-independent coproporphyrinogen-3 oxidase
MAQLSLERTDSLLAGTGFSAPLPYRRNPLNFEIIYNYPPANHVPVWQDQTAAPAFTGAAPRGIYVHIPFCTATCTYCHYTRKRLDAPEEADRYVKALGKEAVLWRNACGGASQPLEILTVFVGGGTPTILSAKQIEVVTSLLRETFGASKLQEYTWEASPETIVGEDAAKLAVLHAASVNRLSIGVQTFDERLLQICGRNHSPAQIHEAYERAREAGFDNINLDLIYALPTQTYADWKQTLDLSVEMAPQSISIHQLRLKAGTSMYNAYAADSGAIPDEKSRLRMLAMAHLLLGDAGYVPIECELFVKDHRYDHQHQMDKWVRFHDLIGIGPAAYGYLADTTYFNYLSSKDYYAAIEAGRLPIWRAEKLPKDVRKARALVLGLMFYRGLDKAWYEQAFGEPVEATYEALLTRLAHEGLIETVDDHIQLTLKGSFYSPEVRKEFYLPQHRGGPGPFGSYFEDFAF